MRVRVQRRHALRYVKGDEQPTVWIVGGRGGVFGNRLNGFDTLPTVKTVGYGYPFPSGLEKLDLSTVNPYAWRLCGTGVVMSCLPPLQFRLP
jgi:hypothetical protein